MAHPVPARPRVHVLLVNYGGWQDTIECLESLLRLDYPSFRIIVCDNGSTNGSLERLKAWADGSLAPDPAESDRLRHLSSPPVPKPVPYREYDRATAERGGRPGPDDAPLVLMQTGQNLGFAGGNNVGLRYLMARGETGYVWLLNNDTVVAPDSLSELVAVAERDETLGVVGARLLHYADPDVVQAAGGGELRHWSGVGRLRRERDAVEENGSTRRGRRRPRRLDYVTGSSMLVPLRVVTSVGLLDERYFAYSEEADWCLRMRAQRLQMAYAPAAKVWHKGGRSIGQEHPLQDYFVERNGLLLVRKFFTPYVPLAIANSVVRSLIPKLRRGEWARAAAVARAYRDFFRV
jgi:GT2 family glycosyltransferase